MFAPTSLLNMCQGLKKKNCQSCRSHLSDEFYKKKIKKSSIRQVVLQNKSLKSPNSCFVSRRIDLGESVLGEERGRKGCM